MLLNLSVFLFQQFRAQDRHREPRDNERNDEARCHRKRERLEKRAGHSGKKCQWRENDDCGRRGTRKRVGEFTGRTQHVQMRIPRARGAHATNDVLYHHNRIVNDQSDSSGHSAKRHDVEAHVHHVKKQNGRGEHGRHSQRRDQSDFPVAQKNEQDERGKNHPDQDCIPCTVFRRGDEIALIVPVSDLHPFGNLLPDLAQLRFNSGRNLHGISRRLLINLEEHRIATISRDANPLRLG